MLFAPVSQALVAHLAPEHMRGRYMAMFGFAWTIPTGFAPLTAGYITSSLGSQWVWYICGLISIAAIAGYLILHVRMKTELQISVREDKTITEPVTVALPEIAHEEKSI